MFATQLIFFPGIIVRRFLCALVGSPFTQSALVGLCENERSGIGQKGGNIVNFKGPRNLFEYSVAHMD